MSVPAGDDRRAILSALRPVERRRTFEDVLEELERLIAEGRLRAGDRLPSERDLAARFGVSRTSVREAVRVLEALGLVSVRRGAEHGATLLEQPANALAPLFRLYFGLRHVTIEELVELRALLEAWAVAAAARERPAGLLADAAATLERMATDALEPPAFLELDLAFHLTLARASGNAFLPVVLEGSRAAIERAMLGAALRAADWASTRERLHGEHQAILAAVAAGRGRRAAELVERHLRSFYDEHLGVGRRR